VANKAIRESTLIYANLFIFREDSRRVTVHPILSFRAEREISLALDGDFSSQNALVEMTTERLLRRFADESGCDWKPRYVVTVMI
jgi:hypothetical protein